MWTRGKAKQASHVEASNLWCNLNLHSQKFVAFHDELIMRSRDKIIPRNLPIDFLLAIYYCATFFLPFSRSGINWVEDTRVASYANLFWQFKLCSQFLLHIKIEDALISL